MLSGFVIRPRTHLKMWRIGKIYRETSCLRQLMILITARVCYKQKTSTFDLTSCTVQTLTPNYIKFPKYKAQTLGNKGEDETNLIRD